jgi:hypothetical protein
MRMHPNAKGNANSRLVMVLRIEEEGWSVPFPLRGSRSRQFRPHVLEREQESPGARRSSGRRAAARPRAGPADACLLIPGNRLGLRSRIRERMAS